MISEARQMLAKSGYLSGLFEAVKTH